VVRPRRSRFWALADPPAPCRPWAQEGPGGPAVPAAPCSPFDPGWPVSPLSPLAHPASASSDTAAVQAMTWRMRSLPCFGASNPRLGCIGLIKMPLKSNKCVAYLSHAAELSRRIAHGPVLQLQQMRQFGPIQFADAFLDVLEEDEIQKCLKLLIVAGEYLKALEPVLQEKIVTVLSTPMLEIGPDGAWKAC
jgi:hypothetical protein